MLALPLRSHYLIFHYTIQSLKKPCLRVLLLSACFYTGVSQSAHSILPPPSSVQSIAFGSCLEGQKPLSILRTITAAKPDLFVFAGDNVYAQSEADDPELKSLRLAYQELSEAAEFQALSKHIPIVATWDDHDFGLNDAGRDFQHRKASEQLFENFWGVPDTDPSRARPGVYRALRIGQAPQAVQIILLDTRFFRTALKKPWIPLLSGRYVPSDDPSQSMLGEAQWLWLQSVLKEPADLRILVSSVQVLADGHQWESWRMLPKERSKLLGLLAQTNGPTVMISGDRHLAAFYRSKNPGRADLWEITSSSLNLPLSEIASRITPETGGFLEGEATYTANFGWIGIDWSERSLNLELRNPGNIKIDGVKIDF
ncbi:MAG: alkaline phosphatase D family protein [Pseudomonadales bacterium]